jgi:hypothetical protein
MERKQVLAALAVASRWVKIFYGYTETKIGGAVPAPPNPPSFIGGYTGRWIRELAGE